jgi:uncharacterized protein (PEP-CTERM system associated)
MVMAVAGAHAQTVDTQEPVSATGAKPAFSVVPRVSVAETFTDNARLSSVDKRADQITEISPGIRITSETGRVKGYFDYSLRELIYVQNSTPSTTQNALNTFGTVEAVEKRAYLDFSGNISQQAISAFGTQSVGNTATNANLTETSSLRLSPYVRGRLTDAAEYEARYSLTTTRTQSSLVSDVTAADALVKVGSGSGFRLLGWSVEGTQQNINYSAGRTTEADRLRAVLTYAVIPQFRLSAIGGREANNYLSFDKQSYDSTGFGVDWTPSERTKLSASRENRFFGEGHNLSFEHRTGRTVWRFSDVRDSYATPSQSGVGSIGSVYDLFFTQFAANEPDPILRAQLVNNFLLANGINPNAVVLSNFLTSAVSLQRRQNLSFSLLGVRDTVTFMATRSETSQLDSLSTFSGDFSKSSVVSQQGFNASYAHRLTPLTSLNVFASQQNTSGSFALQDSTLRSFTVSVSSLIAKRSTVTFGIRRVVFDSSISPYVETAITGNLTVGF